MLSGSELEVAKLPFQPAKILLGMDFHEFPLHDVRRLVHSEQLALEGSNRESHTAYQPGYRPPGRRFLVGGCVITRDYTSWARKTALRAVGGTDGTEVGRDVGFLPEVFSACPRKLPPAAPRRPRRTVDPTPPGGQMSQLLDSGPDCDIRRRRPEPRSAGRRTPPGTTPAHWRHSRHKRPHEPVGSSPAGIGRVSSGRGAADSPSQPSRMAFPVSRVCIGRLAPQNGAGAALGGNGRATGGPRAPPCFGHELLGGFMTQEQPPHRRLPSAAASWSCA